MGIADQPHPGGRARPLYLPHRQTARGGIGTWLRAGRRDPSSEPIHRGRYRVFTLNPTGTDLTVFCFVAAFDPAGRLLYSGLIPPSHPGHPRSSGFDASPGRLGHGVFVIPIDPTVDRYTARCRPAAWHGGAPIYGSRERGA